MVFNKKNFLYSNFLFYSFINLSIEHGHGEITDNQDQKYLEQ